MRRNRHNGTGAVAHHDIVGDENRDFLAAHRVHCGKSLNANARLVLDKLGSLELGFVRSLLAVGEHSVHVSDAVRQLVDERMLRRNHHKGHTEERITARCIDLKFFVHILQREFYESTGRLTDPVELLLLDVLGVIHLVEPKKQLVRILGNL